MKSQLKTPTCASITNMINANDKIIVLMGPILIPIELSSKNRINPAPPMGIGVLPLLLFFLLDCVWLLDIIKKTLLRYNLYKYLKKFKISQKSFKNYYNNFL